MIVLPYVIVMVAALSESIVFTQLGILGVVPALVIITIVRLSSRLSWLSVVNLVLLAGLAESLVLPDWQRVMAAFGLLAAVLGFWRLLEQAAHFADEPLSRAHQAAIVAVTIPLFFMVRYPVIDESISVFAWLNYVGLTVVLSLVLWFIMQLEFGRERS